MDDNELFSGANNAAAQGVTLEARVPQIDDSQLFEGATQAAKSEQPAKQFNLSAEVRNYLDTGIKYAQSKAVAGQHDLSDSLIWAQAMAGTMKYEDALNETSDQKKEEYRAQNIDPIEKTLWLTDPRRLIGEVAQMAPYMASITAGGAATALVGGGIGSTIPGVGTLVGAGTGMAGGTFTTASVLATGSMYGTLRKQGVSHEAASQFASNYGVASGALNAVRFMGAHDALKKRYESELAKSAIDMAAKGAMGRNFQKAFDNMVHENMRMGVRHMLKEVGLTQVLPAELDEMAKIITETWASKKFDKLSDPKMQKAVFDRLVQTFQQSLLTGVGFVGAGRIAGGASGKISASFKKFMQDIDDAIDSINLEEKERLMPKEELDVKQQRKEVARESKETVADSKEFIKKANLAIKALRKEFEKDPENEQYRNQLRELRKGVLQAQQDKRKAEYKVARQTITEMMEGAEAKFTIEKDEKLKDFRQTRQLLEAAITKSEMSDAHKVELTKMIPKIDSFESLTRSHMSKPKTPGKLPKRIPSAAEVFTKRLDALIEMDAKREAVADLKDQLGRKVIVPAGKKSRGEISYDAQLQFQRYRQLVSDELASPSKHKGLAKGILDKRAAEAAKDAANADAGTPFGLSADIDARIASEVIDLKNKTAKEINKIADKIERVVDDGENSHLAKKQRETAERAARLRDAIKQANGEYPIYEETRVNGQKHITKRAFSDDARRVNSFGMKFMTWDMFVKNMFQDSKDNNAHFLLDIHDAVQNAEADHKYWRQRYFDMATNGDKNLAKSFEKLHREARLEDKDIGKLRFTNQDGVSVNLSSLVEDGKINRNILMKIYLAMKNPMRRDGLRNGNKLTWGDNALNNYQLKDTEISAQALIEKTLTKEEKQIADNISKFWNDSEFTDHIQENHIDEYALPMKQHDQYDGSMYRIGDKAEEGSWLDINNDFNARRSNVPDSLVQTVQSEKPYRFEPLTASNGRQLAKLSNWGNFRKPYKDILYVLKDKQFREIVNTKFDSDFMQTVDAAFESIVGQRGISIDNQFKLADIYNRNAAAAFTTGKIPSAFAQYAGIVNVMQEIGPIDTAIGIGSFFANPVRNIKMLMNTTYMKNRAGSIDNFMREIETSNYKTDFAGTQGHLSDWYAFPMRSTDQDVHMISGYAVYAKFYDEAYARTKNKETAHAAGIAMFERVMNRTQGSAMADQITSFERGGSVQKGLATFFKQPIQAFNYQMLGWKRVMANPNINNIKDALCIMGAAHAAQGIFEIMKSAPDLANPDIEESEKDKMIVRAGRQFINGPLIPGFSQLVEAIEIPITNKMFNVKERAFEANVPYLSSIMSVRDLSALATEIAEKGDLTFKQMLQGLDDFSRVSPFFTKAPIGAGNKQLKRLDKNAKAYQKRQGTSQESDEPITIKRIPEYEDTGEDDGEDAEQ